MNRIYNSIKPKILYLTALTSQNFSCHKIIHDLKKIKNINISTKSVVPKPVVSSTAIMLVMILIIGLIPQTKSPVFGAYTSASTDADGNTHLSSNTVNDTNLYDTSQDSSAGTQQQLGVDPNWANGVTRKSSALKFDGSNDYVTITKNTSFIFSGDFTVELWFKTATTGTQVLIGNRQGGATYSGFTIYTSSGNLIAAYGDGSSASTALSGAFSYADSKWHHIALVVKRTNGSALNALYVDGSLLNSNTGTVSGQVGNYGNLGIGAYVTASAPFNGVIDEVRLSSAARYSSAFSPLRRFVEDLNTPGLWHLDESGGTTVADSSQNSNTGTLMNGTSNSPAADGSANGPIFVTGSNAIMDGYKGDSADGTTAITTSGQTGAGNITIGSDSSTTGGTSYEAKVSGSNGLTFDGSNDYVYVPGSAALRPTNLTLEAWIKTTDTVNTARYPVSYSTYGFIINRWTSNGKIIFKFRNIYGAGEECTSSSAINNGLWHHVAGVLDNSNLQYNIYIDGSLDAACKMNAAIGYTSTENLFIGSGSTSSGMFLGSVDEVRISSSLRYTGKTTFTPTRRFATDRNTVGLWHLDEGSGTTTIDTSGNGGTGTFYNGSSNSPAADGTTYGPLWVEGITSLASSSNGSTSASWAMPGYQYRKKINIANNVASILGTGYGVETTENRATLMDSNQMLSNGNDTRVVYQPSNASSSLSFDGGDYVYVPNATNAVANLTNYTIDLWFKTTSGSTSDNRLYCEGNTSTTTPVVFISYGFVSGGPAPGKISFYTRDDAGTVNWIYSQPGNFNDGNWHQVSVVRNSTTSLFYLYVDGVLHNTGSATVGTTTVNRVSFGAHIRTSIGNFLSGSLDEVRVSNTARYSGAYMPSTKQFVSDGNTIGLWHFDEGSGQIVRDYSDYGNNGNFGADASSSTDDPTWSTDGAVSTTQEVPREIPYGHTLEYNNANTAYARNGNKIITAAGSFTVEAWFKLDSVVDTNTIVSQGALADGGYIAISTNSSGHVVYRVDGYGAHDIIGNGTVVANTWYHVALVYNGAKSVGYLNGVYDGTASYAADVTHGDNVTVGGNAAATPIGPMAGQIDEVRISNSVRYKNNFNPQTTPFAKDTNTLALWHFDDGTGTTAIDQTGNFNLDLTDHAPVWVLNGGKVDSINQTQFKTIAPIAASSSDSNYYLYYGNLNEKSAAQSYANYGVKFDGSNDYIITGSFAAASTITESFWLKTSSSSGGVLKWGANRICKMSALVTHKLACAVDGTDAGAATTTNDVDDGVWHHIVLVSSASAQTIYMDGVSSGTATETLTTSAGTLEIGRSASYNNGYIDDVRIYTRALSASEVSALYTNSPYVSNASLAGWWKLDQTGCSGNGPCTTATDSSGSGNTGTLTNFNFDQNSNWTVNSNLLHATTEPTVTMVSATPEQESPVFFQWRTSTGGPSPTYGSWSTRTQISYTNTQLGSSGVYIRFNPRGLYSYNDIYKINSWAVEAFSTTRGNKNSFPDKANLVASDGGVDIIDASTNKLWARFTKASNNLIGSNNSLQITALNGRIYVASADGLTEIRLDDDTAVRYTSSGNSLYSSAIANRNAASTYAAAAGNALNSTTVNDVSATVIGTSPPKQYVAVATGADLSVINNVTGIAVNNTAPTDSPIYDYAATASDTYANVVLTNGGRLYGSNTTHAGLDIYTSVNSDSADQTGTTDAVYNTTTTPAIRSTTINDISVTTGTSLADYTSNQVALGTDVGAEVIHEHSTFASGYTEHYVRTGATGTSGYASKDFGNALKFDGTDDYAIYSSLSQVDSTAGHYNTVEFWMLWDGTIPSSWAMPFVFTGGGNYSLTFRSSCFGFNTGKGECYGINSTSLANTWVHIAAIFNNGNVTLNKIYVNGVSQSLSYLVGTDSNSYTAGTGVQIGRYSSAIYYYRGLIDELRISNFARYSGNFTPTTKELTTDANTVGLWHFNERYGGAAGVNGQYVYDDSGNSNNGTLGASASISTDDPLRVSPSLGGTSDNISAVGLMKSGDTGRDVYLDGSNDYIHVGDPADGDLDFGTSSFSYGMWINNPSFIGAYDMPIYKGGSSSPVAGYDLEFGSGNWVAHLSDGTTMATGTFTTGASNNQWYFVMAVVNRTNNKFYVYLNGLPGSTTGVDISSLGSISNAASLEIGIKTGGSYPMNGYLRNVQIYSKALTGSEVASLYNGGLGRVDNPVSGLVGWWKLTESSGTTATDSSGGGNNGTLMNGTSNSPAANGTTYGPVWSSGSPLKGQSALWVGTSTSSGAVTAISLNTQRQIASYTSSNSSLPSNNVSSLGLGLGGLAIAGTDGGAWPAGLAGFPVDDTASTKSANYSPVRVDSGTVRINGGTIRVK